MLAARYPKALERLWVIEDVPEGESPSLLRDHVLDCPGGVRLVVSRDSYQGEICTHVSANLDSEFVPKHIDGLLRMMNPRATFNAIVKMIREAYHKISGVDLPANPEYVSDLGIPHWSVRIPRDLTSA